jgi:heme exporter protein D
VNKLLVTVTVWTAASCALAPVVGWWLKRNRQRHEQLDELLDTLQRDVERERDGVKAGDR